MASARWACPRWWNCRSSACSATGSASPKLTCRQVVLATKISIFTKIKTSALADSGRSPGVVLCTDGSHVAVRAPSASQTRPAAPPPPTGQRRPAPLLHSLSPRSGWPTEPIERTRDLYRSRFGFVCLRVCVRASACVLLGHQQNILYQKKNSQLTNQLEKAVLTAGSHKLNANFLLSLYLCYIFCFYIRIFTLTLLLYVSHHIVLCNSLSIMCCCCYINFSSEASYQSTCVEWLFLVGYTMRDIRYKWNEGPNSVGVSNEVSLPQFKVLGHRQRAHEISLTTGTAPIELTSKLSLSKKNILPGSKFPTVIFYIYIHKPLSPFLLSCSVLVLFGCAPTEKTANVLTFAVFGAARPV